MLGFPSRFAAFAGRAGGAAAHASVTSGRYPW